MVWPSSQTRTAWLGHAPCQVLSCVLDGRTAGEQAGVAPAMVARLSRLRWYNLSGLPPRRPWLGQLDLPRGLVSHRRLPRACQMGSIWAKVFRWPGADITN